MSVVTAFVVGSLLMTGCLWAGMKLTRVDGSVLATLVIALIANGVELVLSWFGSAVGGEIGAGIVGACGWILVAVVLLVLISKWTSAYIWPDAVLVVLVANIVSAVALGLLGGVA